MLAPGKVSSLLGIPFLSPLPFPTFLLTLCKEIDKILKGKKKNKKFGYKLTKWWLEYPHVHSDIILNRQKVEVPCMSLRGMEGFYSLKKEGNADPWYHADGP